MLPVTVLLRTWNAGGYLRPLLETLAAQTRPPDEILVVDSQSTDGTPEGAARAGARVIPIPKASFTHAVSTNLGFREARGEIVAMLSQDALPCDAHWLARLTAPLADPDTAAVFGRQRPRPGCFPLERWELERSYPPGPPPGVAYSNVNSAARRSVWRTTPFDESVTIAEDRLWARSVTGAGLRVVYEPAASVWHSHRYSLREVYRRCREEAASRRTVEGRTETVGLLLKAWPRQTARDARRLAAEGTLLTWPHAAAYRFAQFAGMMAGGRP